MTVLTLKKVIAANRKAYAEKRLGAQRFPRIQCVYDYGNNVGCAIGVALSKKEKANIISENLNHQSLRSLLEDYSEIRLKNEDEYALLSLIQQAHDNWLDREELAFSLLTVPPDSRLGKFVTKLGQKPMTGPLFLKLLDKIEEHVSEKR